MNRFKRIIYHINKLRWGEYMKVIFQGEGGAKIFESYDENISDLLVIVNVKINMYIFACLSMYKINH
ncbi:hypothetical protein P4I94_29820, partial [Bacillus cereus]|nr:hypothetical protein [Bacillus cereus]